MPEDGQEHVLDYMLLPSRSSFGCKAINLLNWGEAPSQVKERNYNPPVGHMSIFCCPMTHMVISQINGIRIHDSGLDSEPVKIEVVDQIALKLPSK